MFISSLTYQQSIFEHYHSGKHFSDFTYKMAAKINWQKNYVTVTLCIAVSLLAYFNKQYYRYLHLNITTIAAYVSTFVATFIF